MYDLLMTKVSCLLAGLTTIHIAFLLGQLHSILVIFLGGCPMPCQGSWCLYCNFGFNLRVHHSCLSGTLPLESDPAIHCLTLDASKAVRQDFMTLQLFILYNWKITNMWVILASCQLELQSDLLGPQLDLLLCVDAGKTLF